MPAGQPLPFAPARSKRTRRTRSRISLYSSLNSRSGGLGLETRFLISVTKLHLGFVPRYVQVPIVTFHSSGRLHLYFRPGASRRFTDPRLAMRAALLLASTPGAPATPCRIRTYARMSPLRVANRAPECPDWGLLLREPLRQQRPKHETTLTAFGRVSFLLLPSVSASNYRRQRGSKRSILDRLFFSAIDD
jgi:hypothetical protein